MKYLLSARPPRRPARRGRDGITLRAFLPTTTVTLTALSSPPPFPVSSPAAPPPSPRIGAKTTKSVCQKALRLRYSVYLWSGILFVRGFFFFYFIKNSSRPRREETLFVKFYQSCLMRVNNVFTMYFRIIAHGLSELAYPRKNNIYSRPVTRP